MAVAAVARALAVGAPGRGGAGGFWTSVALEPNRRAADGHWILGCAWRGPDPYGGIVLLPILLALLVPMLLTAAAAFSIAFPLALLPLLAARSRLFPTLLAMGVICQVALVLTGWIAADVFARLATQALAAMTESGDAEVLRIGGRTGVGDGHHDPHGSRAGRADAGHACMVGVSSAVGRGGGILRRGHDLRCPARRLTHPPLRWQRLNRGSAPHPSPRRRSQSRMLARGTHVRSPASSPGPHRSVSGHSAR